MASNGKFNAPSGHPNDTLRIRFTEEDGQESVTVAGWLAEFIDGAESTLDIAIYDCRLSAAPAEIISETLYRKLRQGVQIRLIYDHGDKPQTPRGIDRNGADPAPRDTHERVEELGLPPELILGVGGNGGLMHHKYLIRDRKSVWTGSLNLTDDGFRRMDNTILTLDSKPIADLYTRDFEQIWTTRSIEVTGAFQTDPASLSYAGRETLTDVDFSPGQGEQINEWVAAKVRQARRRIVLCSMLINSSKLLGALVDQLDRGQVEISGVYDHTQMMGVLDQWQEIPEIQWKIDAVKRVIREGRLVGKRSLPYRAGASHNFMHNKTVVVDDTVITGSYNLSHAAQGNAENMLAIHNPELAELVIAYTRHLAGRYGDRGRRNKP